MNRRLSDTLIPSSFLCNLPSSGGTHRLAFMPGMTKFETKNDAGFVAVVGELRRWTRQINTEAGNHTVKEAPRETPVTRSDPTTHSITRYRGLTFKFSCRAAAEDGPKRINHHADWKDNANPRILRHLERLLRKDRHHSCFLY
jgi:hypothetical protein